MDTHKDKTKQPLGRLKKRSDFLRVQQAGRKWVAKGLVLQIAGDNGGLGVRFGITATRRLSKSAVVRNRIKRRLRAAASQVLPLHGIPGTDYVLIGRPETAERNFVDLQKDLKWCLEKLALKAREEKA